MRATKVRYSDYDCMLNLDIEGELQSLCSRDAVCMLENENGRRTNKKVILRYDPCMADYMTLHSFPSSPRFEDIRIILVKIGERARQRIANNGGLYDRIVSIDLAISDRDQIGQ